MTNGTWYVNASRAAVTWNTAVVSGAATVDIFKLVVQDKNEQMFLWARATKAVTPAEVAAAQAETSSDPVPRPVQPPADRGGHPFNNSILRSDEDRDVDLTGARIVMPLSAMSSNARHRPVAIGGVVSAQPSQQSSVGTARVPYLVSVAATELRLVYPNWYVNSGADTDNSADLTLKASIEYGGTIYRVTFGGQTSVTVGPGGVATSDPLALDVPAGATVYVRTYTSGSSWYAARYANVAGSGGWTVTTDLTAPGAAAIADATSFTPLIGPAAILGAPLQKPAPPTVLVLGDSISYGQGDGIGNGPGVNTAYAKLGGGGWVGRALNGVGALVNAAVQSDSAAQFFTTNHTRRLVLASHCATLLTAYGRNDITGGSPLSTVQANCIALWTMGANRRMRVIQATVTPRTTSTDGWLTVLNQAVSGNETVRQSFNAWLRAGAPMLAGAATTVNTPGAIYAGDDGHPLHHVIDVADRVETERDSGIWKAPTGARAVTDAAATNGGFNVTSATAAFTTADIGKTIVVAGAGAAGVPFSATIKAINSSTSAAVGTAASTTVSGANATVCDAFTQDGIHPAPAAAAAMAPALTGLA